jgi:hypothetical protein
MNTNTHLFFIYGLIFILILIILLTKTNNNKTKQKEQFTFDDNENNDLITLIGPNSWFDKKSLTDLIYPIGTIMVRHDSQNPATLIPGTTWEDLSKGSNGDGYYIYASSTTTSPTAKSNETRWTTGPTTLTTAQIPSHTHVFTGAATSSTGAHTHTLTVSNAGSHTHTGTANSAGAHTHAGETNYAGNHNHNSTYYRNVKSGSDRRVAPGENIGNWDPAYWPVNAAGDHFHSFTTKSAGAHTHSVTTVSTGDHTHPASATSAGAHTHTISGTISATGSNGSHTHSYRPPYIDVKIWKRIS